MASETSFRRIAGDLQGGIEDGTFPPGTPLPRATDLSAKYRVPPAVITSAFNMLARQNLITGARGGGRRFVLEPPGPEPEPEPVAAEPVAEPVSEPDAAVAVMVGIEVSPTVATLVRMLAQVEGRSEGDVVRHAVETLLEFRKREPAFQLRLRGLIEGLQRFWVPDVEFSPSPPNP